MKEKGQNVHRSTVNMKIPKQGHSSNFTTETHMHFFGSIAEDRNRST